MIEATRLGFDPLLGWWVVWLAAALAGLGWLGYLVKRGRAWLTRGLGLSLLAFALAGPAIVEEDRRPLTSEVALVVDGSESMSFSDRAELAATVRDRISADLAGDDSLEVRVVETNRGDDATRLVAALESVMSDVPRDRIAGAVMITDGQVHDVPKALDLIAPLGPVHGVIVGSDEAGDRRIEIVQSPSFDIVGETTEVTVRIDDPDSDLVQLDATLNGDVILDAVIPANTDYKFDVDVARRGTNTLVVSTPEGQSELTLANNQTAAVINGVRDRLRVLLITGRPHSGARVWRDLLKSDPQVDLVHFTILRPPQKARLEPEEELALIPFPTQSLFEDRLEEFDLIIFDQYTRRGVIQFSYLANMADYVDQGGAMLIVAGPDFAGASSLHRTALAAVLPVSPTGRVIEEGFDAELSETGRRHTITQPLIETGWGQWYRYIETEAEAGDVLLQTPDGSPLLVVDRVGDGRVGQILTDQIWLWARGHQGGGPFAELIRRSVHWLMAEPELEERKLTLSANAETLEISLSTLDAAPPALAVTMPSGETVQTGWQRDPNGNFRASLPSEGLGLYRAEAGGLEAVTLNGPANPLEYSDLSVTTELLSPVAEATEGGVYRVEAEGDTPDVRRVGRRSNASGSDWLGLRERDAYAVIASRSRPLLPGLVGVGLILILMMIAWRREGR